MKKIKTSVGSEKEEREVPITHPHKQDSVGLFASEKPSDYKEKFKKIRDYWMLDIREGNTDWALEQMQVATIKQVLADVKSRIFEYINNELKEADDMKPDEEIDVWIKGIDKVVLKEFKLQLEKIFKDLESGMK